MAAAIQFLTRPRDYSDAYDAVSGDWRHRKVLAEQSGPRPSTASPSAA
jgi:hypothetical protein